MENHAENVHQKLVPDPFVTLANNPNSHSMQEILFINDVFPTQV